LQRAVREGRAVHRRSDATRMRARQR
jgi:hypothetical protein